MARRQADSDTIARRRRRWTVHGRLRSARLFAARGRRAGAPALRVPHRVAARRRRIRFLVWRRRISHGYLLDLYLGPRLRWRPLVHRGIALGRSGAGNGLLPSHHGSVDRPPLFRRILAAAGCGACGVGADRMAARLAINGLSMAGRRLRARRFLVRWLGADPRRLRGILHGHADGERAAGRAAVASAPAHRRVGPGAAALRARRDRGTYRLDRSRRTAADSHAGTVWDCAGPEVARRHVAAYTRFLPQRDP